MLLFRSEEHLAAWLAQRDLQPGGKLTMEQQWRLAQVWYSTRLDPEWRRRTPDEAQAIFTELGMTGEFWTLSR
jgi:hypothetical protein